MAIEFQQVDAEAVRPLRTQVLRPDWGESEALVFEADREEGTYHFALVDMAKSPRSGVDPTEVMRAGRAVAVLTWLRAAPPEEVWEAAGGGGSGEEGEAYRLRGMAVEEGHRRSGLGQRLLSSSLSRLSLYQTQCRVVWCYARESALAFYESEGFEVTGDPFSIEGIGPHRTMWREPPWVMAGEG